MDTPNSPCEGGLTKSTPPKRLSLNNSGLKAWILVSISRYYGLMKKGRGSRSTPNLRGLKQTQWRFFLSSSRIQTESFLAALFPNSLGLPHSSWRSREPRH